ncbi:MAG: enoyl-CoA hydratase [Deltaproteobacteria bacterium]|nr:enoyl-CoA hydratase [Deltaproteobacteria bacterium]
MIVERREGGIVIVTLNRPSKKNAINEPMWDELLAAFTEVGESTTDRVLVLTGAGDAFCSGADLSGNAGDHRHQLQRMHHYNRVGLALHAIPKPTIAKVNGIAVGAGLNFALGCDLVVASDRARFSEIFARRGLSVDLGGSWLLPRLIGMHKAKELVLLADIIGAAEAERIGLVNRVVPHDELDAFVDEWARRLAAGPPLALAMSKRLLANSHSVTLAEALDAEAVSQSVAIASEDTREGIRAFLHKQTPVFKGK